jgi:putative spermidine/putrescine transport system substrate-binding protein
MISARAADALSRQQGLANTRSLPADWQPERIRWLKPVENPPRREALWLRIDSGDQPEKVLIKANDS